MSPFPIPMAARLIGVLTLLLSLAVPAEPPPEGGPRYLDLSARNDGWVLAQSLGVSGSGKHRVVLISYEDPTTTRAIYDLASRYSQPPHSLPIFGVVRAPDHPTEPSANGFDLYLNGLSLGDVPNPDSRFSRLSFLERLLDNISDDYRSGKLGPSRP